MKIILLQPKTPKKIIGEVIAITSPYNLMLLASLTPKDHQVKIIDEYVQKNKFEKANLVAITATTVTSRRAYCIADEYRKRGCTVILGGVHPTLFPKEAKEHADCVVIGEAEELWSTILEDTESGNLKSFYKQKNQTDLSTLPELRLDIIDERKYPAPYLIQCTRGCPHSCTFCTVPVMYGNRIRKRPVSKIINEVRNIKKNSRFGLHKLVSNKIPIFFIDDNLIADRKYAIELFNELKKENIYWTSQIPIYIAKDRELLDLAYDSGLRVIIIGYESLSNKSLQECNKYNLLQEYEELTKRIKERNIMIYGQFIFGFDNDTKDIFKTTREFIEKTDIDFCEFYILKPYPKTKLYDKLKKEKRLIADVWDDSSYLCFRPKSMSESELINGVKDISLWFYSPKNILRMMKSFSFRYIYRELYRIIVYLFNMKRVKEMYQPLK